MKYNEKIISGLSQIHISLPDFNFFKWKRVRSGHIEGATTTGIIIFKELKEEGGRKARWGEVDVRLIVLPEGKERRGEEV